MFDEYLTSFRGKAKPRPNCRTGETEPVPAKNVVLENYVDALLKSGLLEKELVRKLPSKIEIR
jgi:hypothetical protein